MASLSSAIGAGTDPQAVYTPGQRFTLATWIAAGTGICALREIFSQQPARHRRY